jgi:heptosyltransferase-1
MGATLPVRLDGARRILLIKPSALGDVVHALPVAATLKRRYPSIPLDWLVEEEAADIVRGHPGVAEVVVSGRKRWLRQLASPARLPETLGEIRRFIARLGGGRYDAVLDLQGLLKSSLYLLATRAPVRVGFAAAREGARLALTHQVATPPQPVHAVDRYLALAAAVDATEAVREFTIALTPADRETARTLLASLPRPRIVLHPSARWRTKLWLPERWRELAGALSGSGCGVILTGGAADAALAAGIVAGLERPPLDLVGRVGLKGLAAVLREVDLLVTVDSGPMHIAAAAGTAVLALFGPTDPRRTGPLGPGRVLRRDLACSPCLARRCRIPERFRCMRELEVGEVLREVWGLVGAPAAPRDPGGAEP